MYLFQVKFTAVFFLLEIWPYEIDKWEKIKIILHEYIVYITKKLCIMNNYPLNEFIKLKYILHH